MVVTQEARRKALEKAREAAEDPSAHAENVQLPYKDGKQGPFIVVSASVHAVVFNPRSHRIQSQLESHPKRQIVHDEPYSEEAQAVIHEILSETEGFEPLKENLREYGQKDYGVVTRDGLLVNANTRLAALRELEVDYIKAALLPPDADEQAIDRLELELQVQKNFKQEYTFTNELLFINELLLSPGYSEEKVAKALNYAASGDADELKRGTKRVKQSIRLLGMIREIQDLGKGAVPLTFFDDNKQALIDLDDEIDRLQDFEAAERIKFARFTGILSGAKYRDLRKISELSIQETLVPLLEEKEGTGEEFATLFNEPEAPPGETVSDDAELLAGPASEDSTEGTADESKDLRALAELIASSFGEDEIELPSGKKISRDEVVNEVAEAFEETSEEVRSADKAAKNLDNPVKQLDESVKKAKAALGGFRQFHSDKGFNGGQFEFFLKKLKLEVAAIEKAIEQAQSKP